MGAVGLNFGSPTSGAGFDVGATVSQIVANLENVETPWKTQLTSLESQDTAISSLGTLFSNLSNDLSELTDLQGIMSQKTGSSSDNNVLELTSATSSAVAGTHTVEVKNLATTASGYLSEVPSASTTLSGAITLKVGTGTAQTITLTSKDNTLSGLAAAINASGVGISASVLTDATGSRLSLVSGTSGANGNITVSGSTLAAPVANTLGYSGIVGSSTVTSNGTLAPVGNLSDVLTGTISIQVGTGGAQTIYLGPPSSAPSGDLATGTSDNTVTSLASFIQANSAELGVQAAVVTNSDGTSSLSLTSNTPGTAGTLTVNSGIGDPATALGFNSTVKGSNANLTVDGVNLTSASNMVTNLIPGVTFQLLAPSATESDNSLEQVQVVIGNDNTDVESTVNQFVNDYNSLISGINTQDGSDSSGHPEPLFGSPTLTLLQQQLMNGLNTQNPNGALDSISANTNATLSGSITIQVGSGKANNVPIASGSSMSDLAEAINSAGIGVRAAVITHGTESSLSLLSGTAGASGALTVSSAIVATGDTPLSYSGTSGTSTTTSSGTLTSVPSSGDVLSGSISIGIGNGASTAVSMDAVNSAEGGTTLTDLESFITANSSALGVSASIVPNSDGSSSLSLESLTAGTAGTIYVTSSLLDTTNLTPTTLNYTNSSDISTLANLGITVSPKDDGSLSFDPSTLDSVLNSDYGGVVGFFQNVSSWGQSFATILTNSGSSSSKGVLALAAKSNSSSESLLNAEVAKEEGLISIEQKSLTAELNSANEIMQELPSQLQGINELYAAITGYNQNANG